MIPPLQLEEQAPLTQGRSRRVYQHPDEPNWLVKVIRPEVVEARFGSGAAWYKRRRRFGRYLSYIRETKEYIAGWASHGQSLPFLQKVVGFAETDLGLGLIIEAVRGRDGQLAKPLSALLREGTFDDSAKRALDHFFHQLLNCDVIISDLNPGNLVYAYRANEGDCFVMVDGLGNPNIWPLKAMSRRINRRSKLGRFRQLQAKIERLAR